MPKGLKVTLKVFVIVITIIVFLMLASLLAFNITYTKSTVNGLSMYPTLNRDISSGSDRVFINRFEDGNVGDIVVAKVKDEENWDHTIEGDYVIKRFIAKAGDKVKIVNPRLNYYELLVNNEVFYTKEIEGLVPTYENFNYYVNMHKAEEGRVEDGALVLFKGEIFLMGDNWETSYDCATAGPISASSLVGRVDIIVPASQNLVWGAIKGIFKMWFN